MPDLTIFENYPNSWRLDHPDFGYVCKTTFAKGVITDFEKVSDNPLKVKSKVKVKGNWGESDFIPLFYHPKEKYWDDLSGAPLAIDFNQGGGYFERAWMSFRCGDEVAVMLKEGVPQRVVGFADGKPKIGEDILKIGAVPDLSLPDSYYSMAGAMNAVPTINNSELGPDGLPLQLIEKAQHIEGGKSTNTLSSWYTGEFLGPCTSAQTPPPPPITSWTYLTYEQYDNVTTNKIDAWIVVIGPILYVFLSMTSSGRSIDNVYYYESDTFIQAVVDWCEAMAADPNLHDLPPPVSGNPLYEPTIIDYDPTIGGSQLYAGVYTEELFNNVVASVGSIAPSDIDAEWWPGAPRGLSFQGSGGPFPATAPENVKLYFKPHN